MPLQGCSHWRRFGRTHLWLARTIRMEEDRRPFGFRFSHWWFLFYSITCMKEATVDTIDLRMARFAVTR